MGMRSRILALGRPIHRKLRQQKLSFLFPIMQQAQGDTLLDVGGGSGITGEFLSLYTRFRSVTVVNLAPVSLPEIPGTCTRMVVGSGCGLPFRDASFDWVFSNAVIEHVGGWEEQIRFAREIRRVARLGYFVTTPNRYFPIEPHTYIPFYQFMPKAVQQRLVRLAPGFLHEYERIEMLSARQMKVLFQGATVRSFGPPMLPTSVAAFATLKPS